MEAQVALIGAFSSSVLLGCVFCHLPLDNTPWILYGVQVRQVDWPIKHSNIIVSKQVSCSFVTVGPAGKGNQHLHEACQQTEAQSLLKYPGR